MLLSVVIPTYNRKESLFITLEALARQTYPKDQFEVLVISDGATDGTNEALLNYAKSAVFRLRPIFQENRGPARARNHGIEEAQGDVIVFIDDDIEPIPSFLENHASHHETDLNVVVIGPMSPDPKRRGTEPAWIAWEHAMLEKQYVNWRNGTWQQAWPNQFYSGNASLRRAHLTSIGGFDETFKRQEDVELAYRLERECQVHFVFDAQIDGMHRPSRTFQSWLNVPAAYGQLDVIRARRGDVSWDVVRNSYRARSFPTRFLALLTLAWPVLSQPMRSLLLIGANSTYRLGLAPLAFGALSMIFNICYLENAQAELGAAEMRRLLA